MNFDKESKSEKKENVGLKVGGWDGGWGGVRGGVNTETKPVCQTVKRGKIQNSNHLHNVNHVVQSTFQKYVNNF